MSEPFRFLLEYRDTGEVNVLGLDFDGIITHSKLIGVYKDGENFLVPLTIAKESGWVRAFQNDEGFRGDGCVMYDIRPDFLTVKVVGERRSKSEMLSLVKNAGIPALDVPRQHFNKEDGTNHVSVELEVPLNWTWDSLTTV